MCEEDCPDRESHEVIVLIAIVFADISYTTHNFCAIFHLYSSLPLFSPEKNCIKQLVIVSTEKERDRDRDREMETEGEGRDLCSLERKNHCFSKKEEFFSFYILAKKRKRKGERAKTEGNKLCKKSNERDGKIKS